MMEVRDLHTVNIYQISKKDAAESSDKPEAAMSLLETHRNMVSAKVIKVS